MLTKIIAILAFVFSLITYIFINDMMNYIDGKPVKLRFMEDKYEKFKQNIRGTYLLNTKNNVNIVRSYIINKYTNIGGVVEVEEDGKEVKKSFVGKSLRYFIKKGYKISGLYINNIGGIDLNGYLKLSEGTIDKMIEGGNVLYGDNKKQ